MQSADITKLCFSKKKKCGKNRENAAEEERAEAPFFYGVTTLCGAKICITQSRTEAEEFLSGNGGSGEQKILYADAEKLRGGVLRFKRAEDTFEKFGGGRKSLKKYLSDFRNGNFRRREVHGEYARKGISRLSCGADVKKLGKNEKRASDTSGAKHIKYG